MTISTKLPSFCGTPPLSPLTTSFQLHHLSPVVYPRSISPDRMLPVLPYDVLRYIFDFIPLQQLLNVALVCRTFGSAAIDAIIGRMHYTRGDEVIWSGPGDLTLIRALCREKSRIPRLVYIFQHTVSETAFVDEVNRVRRFLTHSRHNSPEACTPQEVVLELCHTTPSFFGLHAPKRHEKRWAGPLCELFDDIIMFTQSLTVRCGPVLRQLRKRDIHRVAEHLRLDEQCPRLAVEQSPPLPVGLIEWARTIMSQCLPHVFGYGTGCCRDGIEMRELPFYVEGGDLHNSVDLWRPALPPPGPKVLNIHSPILFHPALIRWTLGLLSRRCMEVTHLSFRHAGISRACWAEIFRYIQAPSLKSFDFNSCSFPTLDAAKFVARNEQLERLSLGPNIAESHASTEDVRPSWLKLPNVTCIEASSGCFSRLLIGPDQSVAPKMEKATIFLQGDTIGDMDRSLSLVHNRLSPVDLTLQLVMENHKNDWFRSQVLPTAPSPRAPIRNQVTRLRICADIRGLVSDFWLYLPSWVEKFLPGLTNLMIVERQPDYSHECRGFLSEIDISHHVRTLVGGLRRSCPKVVHLQVGDISYSLEAWVQK